MSKFTIIKDVSIIKCEEVQGSIGWWSRYHYFELDSFTGKGLSVIKGNIPELLLVGDPLSPECY